VTVHRAELLWHEADRAAFEIECSSGTYVRQLISALGDAYCEELERTVVGPFSLFDADPGRVVPVSEALAFLPSRQLDEEEAARVAHGVLVPARDVAAGSAVRLIHAGDLVAIAEPRGRDLHPVVVFAA
jgi:tRNA pseudouridine55 synthase